MLIAAAQRDDAGALEALDRMRAAVRLGSVTQAIELAAEVLAETTIEMRAG